MMSMVGRFRGGLKMLRATTTVAPPNHRRIIGGGGGVPNPRSFRTNQTYTPPQNPNYAGPTKFYTKSDQHAGGYTWGDFFSELYDSVCDFVTDFRITTCQFFVMFGVVFVLPPVAQVCDDLFNPNCIPYHWDKSHVTYIFNRLDSH